MESRVVVVVVVVFVVVFALLHHAAGHPCDTSVHDGDDEVDRVCD